MTTPQFQKNPDSYSVRDTQQMVWVLSGDSLIAAPSNNSVEPVTLDLIACRNTEFRDEEKGNLVYLAISGKKLCLYCTETEGKPTLQLKEVSIMDLYKSTAQKPFLFFHSVEGSTSVFQSVSYLDWFIATSSKARQPVILTQGRGLTHNTNFYLSPQN